MSVERQAKRNSLGYGATCSKHLNHDDGPKTVCKRQITLAKCSGDLALARRAMKAWLYMGHFLEEGASRTEHFAVDPLQEAAFWTEEALDQAVTQL